MKKVIVSRHPAAVEFVHSVLPDWETAEVFDHISVEELVELGPASAIVGNLPLPMISDASLSDHGPCYYGMIEISMNRLERGSELTFEKMKEVGSNIRWWMVVVQRAAPGLPTCDGYHGHSLIPTTYEQMKERCAGRI